MIIWEREGGWLAEVTPPSRGARLLPAARAVPGQREAGHWKVSRGHSLSPATRVVPWVSERCSFFFFFFSYQNWQLAYGNWASAESQVLCADNPRCPEPGGFLRICSLLSLGLIFMSLSSLGGCNTLCLGLSLVAGCLHLAGSRESLPEVKR